MKIEKKNINLIPSTIWGSQSDKIYIYIHGKNSKKEYADKLAEEGNVKGFQVISFDLPKHGERKNEDKQFIIQNCVPELISIYDYVSKNWKEISIYASSIGAYFSLVAYENYRINNCLFESPVLDMERVITNMMGWFNVTEYDLERKKEIETPIGETLSWQYLTYVREHKISKWKNETHIIYGENDNITERDVIDSFINNYNAKLTLVKNGEHFLHSTEELNKLSNWIKEYAY